jgi:hypothetical protein
VSTPLLAHRSDYFTGPRHGRDRDVLRVIEAIGIAPVALLQALLTARGVVRSNNILTRSLARLEKRGVLTRLSVAELGVHEADNVRWFVCPGPRWSEAAEILGYDPDPAITWDAARSVLIEQAVLGADLVARVAQGADAFRDRAWVLAAAKWEADLQLSKRRWRIAQAGDGTKLPVPDDVRIAGVVPAPEHREVHPIVYVGGGWTPVALLSAMRFTFGILAPLDFAYVRKHPQWREDLRRCATAMVTERVTPGLLPLAKMGTGLRWQRFWKGIFTTLAQCTSEESHERIAARLCDGLCAAGRAPRPFASSQRVRSGQ